MASGGTLIHEGAYIATGSALSIEKVGFRPKYVRLFNQDDASFMEHYDGMADASFALQKAGSSSLVSSAGITLTDKGFDIGTNADLNTAGEQVFFVAFGQ